MEHKCLVIFLLIGTALAGNNSNECSENRVQACIDTLLEKALSSSSTDDDEMCTLLNETSQCLRDTVQECLGDNRDEDIDKMLDEMDEQIKGKCPAEEGRDLAENDSGLCSQSSVEACVDTLIEKTMTTEEDEMCPVLKEASQCLRNTAQACLGDETDEDMDQALDEMDARIRQRCGEEDDESEEPSYEDNSDNDQKCVKENEDYIMSCISESAMEAAQMTIVDSDALKCTLYSLVAECVTTRMGEKCGEEVREAVKKEMDDKPEEIEEACNNSEAVDIFSVSLLDMRRKRK